MRHKFLLIYEVLLFFLALLSVILIWYTHPIARYINFSVWLIFAVDVITRLIKSDNKTDYIKKNPFDFIAINPFDSIFQLARFVRLFRVVRFILISKHYAKPVISILKTNGLDRLIGITISLILIFSIPVMLVEPSINSYQDAVWWSIVTSTTVGYGDISPSTVIGRIIAVFLMLIGIGLIGMVTGAIATFFIKDPVKSVTPEIEFIKQKLDRYEELSDEDIGRIIEMLTYIKEKKNKISI
ncbi:two pore domain potassium channel family protein [Gracilibacillus salitolerans]|uniref:Two pore domain potassium channel family protein n=1 Tax=Gracilibacillus salitolerans TaxID=2663022 RepID=A0A5Q2TI77_9BACI|nr:potassium channel family protein [Gracilibacillus salitolerans]QGH33693.1 two pore domain potassium channel family protein [Gracilibacillus salitolerans]